MAEMLHVNANLMGASAVQSALHQTDSTARLQHVVIGSRGPSTARIHRHFLAMHPMPSDRGIDRAAGTFEGPGDQREIDFRNLTFGKLPGEFLMRRVIFGRDHGAAGFLIEAMNNSGPLLSADPGKAGAMMEQGVDQRVRLVSGAGMHDEARRLIEHEQIVVLEKNRERNLLGLGVNFMKGRNGQPNDIAGLHGLAGATDFPCKTTSPARIKACSRERENCGSASARKRSRRTPV